MVTLVKKINKFNKIFDREEKAVIILSSLVTIVAVLIGFMLLCMLTVKMFDIFVQLVGSHFEKALQAIIDIVLPGWKIM